MHTLYSERIVVDSDKVCISGAYRVKVMDDGATQEGFALLDVDKGRFGIEIYWDLNSMARAYSQRCEKDSFQMPEFPNNTLKATFNVAKSLDQFLLEFGPMEEWEKIDFKADLVDILNGID